MLYLNEVGAGAVDVDGDGGNGVGRDRRGIRAGADDGQVEDRSGRVEFYGPTAKY